ncbi:hypothetical protein DFH06DRAFT_1313170 [Mycena polygramma]|nr:hypothetical protein DFH06DRAFT_1313170 [Mycena polygramma]
MRFFKFLHRRSKSDSSIPKPAPPRDHILRPQSLDAAQTALFTAVAPHCPQTFLFPTPTDTSNAIFEIETANLRLRSEASALAGECAQLRSQLDATRADLFTQLHRNSLIQRQAQADRLDMDALQTKLAQYERFLGLMISVGLHQRVLGDAHAALRAGIDPDVALVDAIKDAAADPESPWSTIIPSVTGTRTKDEYRSSLNLTLKTRKELRDTRKIAKFWKRVAQEDGRNGIVTPSVSAISSIHEPLPAERQRAVEELMDSRRRASLTSQTVARELADASGEFAAVSASTSSASTTADGIPHNDITPSDSGSELPPLASESFKSELAGLSSNTRLFRRSPSTVSKQSRPPLGQIDLNTASTRAQNPSPKRTKLSVKRKLDTRAENIPQVPQVPTPPSDARPRAQALSVPNVVPSFSKHSICSNRLGPLGRIDEEREDFVAETLDEPEPDDANISRESNWSMLDFSHQDLSFSFCDTTISTAPTTPEKDETAAEILPPSPTSRLPKPVLKQLNRIKRVGLQPHGSLYLYKVEGSLHAHEAVTISVLSVYFDGYLCSGSE